MWWKVVSSSVHVPTDTAFSVSRIYKSSPYTGPSDERRTDKVIRAFSGNVRGASAEKPTKSVSTLPSLVGQPVRRTTPSPGKQSTLERVKSLKTPSGLITTDPSSSVGHSEFPSKSYSA